MDNLSFSGSNDTGRSASIHQSSERPTSHDSRQSWSTYASVQHPCDISVRSSPASSSTFSADEVDDRSSVASASSSSFSASQPNDDSSMTSRTASTLSLISDIQVGDESSGVSLGATSSTILAWSPNDGSPIASRTSAASLPFSETQVNSINSSASPIPNYISSTEPQYNEVESSYRLPTNTINIWNTNISRGRGRDSNNRPSGASANRSIESVSLHGHSIDAANRNEATQRRRHRHLKLTGRGYSRSRANSRDRNRARSVIVDIVSDELRDDNDSGSRNSEASAPGHAQTAGEGNADALSTTDGELKLPLILCCKIEFQYIVIICIID